MLIIKCKKLSAMFPKLNQSTVTYGYKNLFDLIFLFIFRLVFDLISVPTDLVENRILQKFVKCINCSSYFCAFLVLRFSLLLPIRTLKGNDDEWRLESSSTRLRQYFGLNCKKYGYCKCGLNFEFKTLLFI